MKLRVGTCLLSLLVLAACAGGRVEKIEELKELPADFPVEVREKFEVRDASSLSEKQEPAKEVSAKKEKSKKKKIQKKSKKQFVYPLRRPQKDPIWVGEESVYEITYFGMSAGDFILNVLPYKAISERKVYHIRGTVKSSSVFSLFYRLNDMVESFIDFDGIFSHRFHLVLDESKQTRDALELYDSEKRQTYYWNRWNHKDSGRQETKEYADIPSFTQDTLSSLFYLRTIPLNDGSVVSFPVVSEGKTLEALITVVRRESIDSPLGRVPTVVLKPETKFQGNIQKRGDSFIWITDDERRIVVRVEAKVKVGTIVARLKKFSAGDPPAQ